MKYLLLTLGLFICNHTFGQTTPKLTTFLNECILKGKKTDAYDSTKKNFVHFYAVALSFDKEGKIDTLHYSDKLNPETKQLYSLDNSLLKRMKTHNFKFKEYTSQTVLIPVFYYNITDSSLDYKNGFLNSLDNLVPEAFSGKAIIILKPIIDANVPREIN